MCPIFMDKNAFDQISDLLTVSFLLLTLAVGAHAYAVWHTASITAMRSLVHTFAKSKQDELQIFYFASKLYREGI